MTPEERAAIDAAMNLWARGALMHLLVLLTLASCAWLAWQRWGDRCAPLVAWLRAGVAHQLTPRYVPTTAPSAPLPSDTEYRDLPDTDQAKPGDTPAPSTSPELPDEAALTRHMASLKKPNGTWWLSANKIAQAVGGEREAALQVIREVRGREVLPNERMLSIDGGKRAIPWEP